MLNLYIRDYEWAKSKPRQIDDETLIDLLRIIEYQAKRIATLGSVGFEDHDDFTDALYVYVLDALGVPATGHKKTFEGETKRFTRECTFSREWFYELFYSTYLLENDQYNYSHQDILQLIRLEMKENIEHHYK
jgi:hypothetical protein